MRRARKLGLTLAIAALAAAAGTASASASTLGIDTAGVLRYTAAPAEANHVRIWFDQTYLVYAVEDTGVTSMSITSKWCHPYTAQIAYCTAGKFGPVDVQLGDGGSYADDELAWTPVTIHGGAGADTLIGGAGPTTLDGAGGFDTLTAGSGTTQLVAGPGGAILNGGSGRVTYVASPDNDEIHARNGVAESISCGAGADSVDADTTDTVASDCETVNRGSADATPVGDAPTGTPDSGTPLTDLPGVDPAHLPLVALSHNPVSLDAHGRVPVALSCPAAAATGCVGTVVLSLAAKAPARHRVVAARRGRRVVSRSRRFKIAAGRKAVVPVQLLRRGARVFRAKGRKTRRTVKLDVAVTMRTEAGAKTTHSTITVKSRRVPARRRR